MFINAIVKSLDHIKLCNYCCFGLISSFDKVSSVLHFRAFVLVIKLHSPDTGLFTAIFGPAGYQGIHLVSQKQKVNVPTIPGVGGAKVSNDWCKTL